MTALEIVSYVAVDDCGRVLDPVIVTGQIHLPAIDARLHGLSGGTSMRADPKCLTAPLG